MQRGAHVPTHGGSCLPALFLRMDLAPSTAMAGDCAADGEICNGSEQCGGSNGFSTCVDNKCRPPGVECEACDALEDCDTTNERGQGFFKCAMDPPYTSLEDPEPAVLPPQFIERQVNTAMYDFDAR